MGPAILLSYPLNVVVDGEEMARKNSKRREWTKTDIRELKSLARAKTPAGKIARSLKRTEGATRQKAFALGVSLDTRGGNGNSRRRIMKPCSQGSGSGRRMRLLSLETLGLAFSEAAKMFRFRSGSNGAGPLLEPRVSHFP